MLIDLSRRNITKFIPSCAHTIRKPYNFPMRKIRCIDCPHDGEMYLISPMNIDEKVLLPGKMRSEIWQLQSSIELIKHTGEALMETTSWMREKRNIRREKRSHLIKQLFRCGIRVEKYFTITRKCKSIKMCCDMLLLSIKRKSHRKN